MKVSILWEAFFVCQGTSFWCKRTLREWEVRISLSSPFEAKSDLRHTIQAGHSVGANHVVGFMSARLVRCHSDPRNTNRAHFRENLKLHEGPARA